MIDATNTRKYRRISVGPGHSVQFRLGSLDLKNIPITNMSAGGCFALLPGTLAHQLHPGTLLMDFQLENEQLPDTTICSRVVRIVKGLTDIQGKDLGLGISFLSTSPHFYEQIDRYVSTHSVQ